MAENKEFYPEVPGVPGSLAADVMLAVDDTYYPDNYQTPERKAMWREAKLQMAESERAAEILAERQEEREKDAIAANNSNIRVAASAAESLERQLAACLSLVGKVTETAMQDDEVHFALRSLENVAKAMSASAVVGQVLGRLRDSYSRVERHVVIDDQRSRAARRRASA
ncbi:MAG TPA: hypothetical protein VGG48_08855 [Rhizomicrobium sp.]|jgi:hypothetical protein